MSFFPQFDEIWMANSCDPCGSNSCNPCGSNGYDPCGGPSNCGPSSCGPNSCGPCASGGIDEEPTTSDCLWQVTVDMSCYNLEDICVYAENNKLIIRAIKEQPAELFFSISREFKREYEVPEEYNMEDVAVYFSCDGILVITIPCTKYREYPIQPIGSARYLIQCRSSGKNGQNCCEDGCKRKPSKPKSPKNKPSDKKEKNKSMEAEEEEDT